MSFNEIWKDLWRRQRVLMLTGAAFLVLLLILIAISLVDSQQVTGVNRWMKPIKFANSIAIYLWTLAFYLYFLPGAAKAKRVIAYGAAAMLTGEIILISMQAARGTASHFNNSTAFDDAVFSAMGLLIVINTLLVIYLTYLYFRAEINLPEAVVWGMRFGLILFLLASFQGGYMSAQIGHAVGVADGGAGLPLFNWSTEGGDLRVAHFVGMHALQAIPLFALMLVRLQKRFSPIRPLVLTVVFAIVYCAAFTLVLTQALKGKPLFGREIIVGAKK
jgi:hypothetical protein